MSGFYRVAYAVGFRPWERAGQQASEEFESLLDRETSQRTAPPGHAVDLGCGTGAHTIELANRGRRAVGVDNQPRAVRIARARAAACRADVTFVRGDVTSLRRDDIGAAADFFADVGCFHHLPRPARQAMAAVTAAAAPGATLLLLAFAPGRRGPLPAGASREEIETTFDGWMILADEPADTAGMARPLQHSASRWYRLGLRPGTPGHLTALTTRTSPGSIAPWPGDTHCDRPDVSGQLAPAPHRWQPLVREALRRGTGRAGG